MFASLLPPWQISRRAILIIILDDFAETLLYEAVLKNS
jgi:hypothetical protein